MKYIDKYGFKALCFLVEEVILAKINTFLEGKEDDAATVSRANEILKSITNLESGIQDLAIRLRSKITNEYVQIRFLNEL
ncbi:MAG: hypothetical protein ACI9SP_004630 [Arenicella sp.]